MKNKVLMVSAVFVILLCAASLASWGISYLIEISFGVSGLSLLQCFVIVLVLQLILMLLK
jgi:hypothetical protein